MSDDEPVPRLPRSRGFKLSTPQLVRIALIGTLLVLVVMVRQPCADSVSKFVTDFGDQGSATTPMPRPGAVEPPGDRGSAADYEPLRPGMTEAEIKAAIDRSRAKAAAERDRVRAGSAGEGAGSASPAGESRANPAGAGSAGSAASAR